MKAIQFSEHGEAGVLQLVDVPKPTPHGNDVLVHVAFAGINRVDIWVRKGGPAYPVSLPHILGADGAGVVEECGPEAEGVSTGNRVVIIPALSCGTCGFCLKGMDNQCEQFEILGAKRQGTYGEYVLVPDQNVVPIPDSLPFDKAAAFPLAYLTAWHMLTSRAKLQPKEKILIVGASAGVAVAAIQIAKWRGATVLAATTDKAKIEKIKTLQPDDVFCEEEGKDLFKWIHKKTNGHGVDVVFEHVGPATWEKSIKSLGKYGRLVTCGGTSGPSVQIDLRTLFSRDMSILGARMGTQREFQELAQLVFEGKIDPVIDKIFPLAEAAGAHAHIESRQQFGKVLLKI
jgi:NADPH:quinone reductase-like Zn-dependent oxidoreductase